MSDFRSIRAAQTPRLRAAHHRVLCYSLACRRPFPPRPQRPSTFEPQSVTHSPAQWCTIWPSCHRSLSTASRITTLIRTGAPPFHKAAALRPERFWSAEKTNAGESKLRSHSQAWLRRGSSLEPENKRSGRLATPPQPPIPILKPRLSSFLRLHSSPSRSPIRATSWARLRSRPTQSSPTSSFAPAGSFP